MKIKKLLSHTLTIAFFLSFVKLGIELNRTAPITAFILYMCGITTWAIIHRQRIVNRELQKNLELLEKQREDIQKLCAGGKE